MTILLRHYCRNCQKKVARQFFGCSILFFAIISQALAATDLAESRIYNNELNPIKNPRPLLADYPEFVEPIREHRHYEAPALIDDEGADLYVRAWRFSMNARGVIEIPNRLKASTVAIIVVHPWGIEDGQGLRIPEPAGFAFGLPEKVATTGEHLAKVVNPFLHSLRDNVGLVMYSLRGEEDNIRRKLYRSFRSKPSAEEIAAGKHELMKKLNEFDYSGGPIPDQLQIGLKTPVKDYFKQFPAGMHGDHYNGVGFWKLPIPVHSAIDVDPDDVVIYDSEGYGALRDFLIQEGIRHILLAGYRTSACYRSTTAGYENLERDFNVFLVGDATLDNNAINITTRFATSAALAEASREHLITQISWIRKSEETVRRSAENQSGSSRKAKLNAK